MEIKSGDFLTKVLYAALVGGAGILYSDLQEVKSDVKKLLENSATNSARIMSLERSLYNNMSYLPTDVILPTAPSNKEDHFPKWEEMVAILTTNETNPKKYEAYA